MGSSKRKATLPEKKAPFKHKKLISAQTTANSVVSKLKVQKFKSGGLARKSQASQEALNRTGMRATNSQQLTGPTETRKVCKKVILGKTVSATTQVTSEDCA